MKKLIALLLALAMVFALAACKGNDAKEETTAAEGEVVTDEAGEVVTDENGEAEVVTDEAEAEETETNAEGEVVTDAEAEEEATDAAGKPAAKPENNKPGTKPEANKPAAQKGLNSTNPNEVAAFYVKARNASTSNPPKGHQVMKLDGPITGEGGVAALLKAGKGIIDKALANNSVETNFIPAGGYADLKGSDITSCSAKVQGNYTIVNIKLKNQVDGANGNKTNGGAVSRGIGTLGSIDEALKELGGAQITEGRDKLTLTYTNAYLNAKIDNNTGKIVGGTYHYLVKLNIQEAKIKLGVLSVGVKGLRANIDYTVKLGTDDK